MPRSIIDVLLKIFLSAFLLVLAFPQTGWWPLAWVALVPLLSAIRHKGYAACFGWSYLFGFIFFSGTLGWFVYVTYPGAILLIAYLSLYTAIFGLACRFFRPMSLPVRIFVLPCVWVALEFIRSHALGGFGWALLGHAQCPNILAIQVAALTGVYGVSFLLVMVNCLLAESMTAKTDPALRRMQAVAMVLVVADMVYGLMVLRHAPAWPRTRVAVVQPNIPQAIKWEERLQPWIVGQTAQLTTALKQEGLDLIVWPETSLPGIMSEVPYLVGAIKLTAAKVDAPLLMGAITDEEGHYFNSAYLIDEHGRISQRYDKMHLVPFGEFLPLRPILGWISRYVPLEDFTSGASYTILKTRAQHPFGVLICFEDTVSYLRRSFAKAGAQFFVNMTNDAWFMDTKAPFIHLQAAIFGCIENRRSLVRAANTGFSGMIDPFGRILASVSNSQHKQTFVAGTAIAEIPLVKDLAFYTKYGDVFTALCFFAILWVGIRRYYEKNTSH